MYGLTLFLTRIEIKKYFPMQHVTEQLLSLYQSILGLRFTEIPAEKARIWHPDVRMFAVNDGATGAFMGAFYMDLYPRYVCCCVVCTSVESVPLTDVRCVFVFASHMHGQ